MTGTANPLAATQQDFQMLLSAHAHIGSKNLDPSMKPYIWSRTKEGIHIHNFAKTWEKLTLAARVIAAIENPADIVVVSQRPYGQRAALKFATNLGCQAIAGRFTPGTFTNYNTKCFREPRLVIVTDPRTDHQAIMEASYVNIPVIAICDSDSSLRYVDVAIPASNKGKKSIGLIYWMLCREVLRLRGTLSRSENWDVMVDMFFYRDPEETETKEKETAAGEEWNGEEPAASADAAWAGAEESWNAADNSNWGDSTAVNATSWAE